MNILKTILPWAIGGFAIGTAVAVAGKIFNFDVPPGLLGAIIGMLVAIFIMRQKRTKNSDK